MTTEERPVGTGTTRESGSEEDQGQDGGRRKKIIIIVSVSIVVFLIVLLIVLLVVFLVVLAKPGETRLKKLLERYCKTGAKWDTFNGYYDFIGAWIGLKGSDDIDSSMPDHHFRYNVKSRI